MELLGYTFFQNALLGSLLAAIACGMVGTYIVARRLAFISGGITHASFGGIGLVLKDHLWEPDRNWGYVQFNSSEEVTNQYAQYADMLLKLIKRGFSAAVYTQTTDVEVEVNGLMTYDRKVVKMDADRVREINRRICRSLSEE